MNAYLYDFLVAKIIVLSYNLYSQVTWAGPSYIGRDQLRRTTEAANSHL